MGPAGRAHSRPDAGRLHSVPCPGLQLGAPRPTRCSSGAPCPVGGKAEAQVPGLWMSALGEWGWGDWRPKGPGASKLEAALLPPAEPSFPVLGGPGWACEPLAVGWLSALFRVTPGARALDSQLGSSSCGRGAGWSCRGCEWPSARGPHWLQAVPPPGASAAWIRP